MERLTKVWWISTAIIKVLNVAIKDPKSLITEIENIQQFFHCRTYSVEEKISDLEYWLVY